MILTALLLLALLLGPGATATKENIAVGAKAVQSSTTSTLGNPEYAVDGNDDSDSRRGSCSHTLTEANPWWRVELPGVYSVTSVTIVNRADCCSERINGAQIRIGNSLKNNGNNNKLVAFIDTMGSEITKTYTFKATIGKFVNVFLPGENRILSLCEVKVYAENIAVGAKAVQSSTTSTLGNPEYAIDGNDDSDSRRGSCSHTLTEANPWWRVELPGVYSVTSVTIVNRADCCSERINGAQIHIGNSLENNGNYNKLVASIDSMGSEIKKTYTFKATNGKFVNVFLPGDNRILSLCEVKVHAEKKVDPDLFDPNENIAVWARAVQSSTTSTLGNPEYAVDGNDDSDSRRGSCSHTLTEANPWWRVELPGVYSVTSVTIVNRADCCSDRINGAQIHIGNSLENNGNNNKLVAVIDSMGSEVTKTYTFKATIGKFVNVFLPGENRILSLCEVKVYAENIAVGAKAVQSSTTSTLGNPEYAVDGNDDPDSSRGSCSHTLTEANPWWRVELPGVYSVTSVTIVNRADCCSERINGAQIRIGNSLENNGNNNKLVAVIDSMGSEITKTYTFKATNGKFVNIFLPGENRILSLCEVKVHAGKKVDPDLFNPNENIAFGAKAVQSSTTSTLGNPEYAVDGNDDSDSRRGSCSHTLTEANPWWRVELPGVYSVTSVTIVNRADCCSERINGAQIRIGNSLENNGNYNKLVAIISSMGSEITKTYTFKATNGKFVNVFLPGENRILSLCEVKVYAEKKVD